MDMFMDYDMSGWQPNVYKRPRDTLQKRVNIAPDKVRGRGIFNPFQILPDTIYNTAGMQRRDSVAFRKMGFIVATYVK